MVKDILVDVGLGEIRLAVLEDGETAEIYIEKNEGKSPVGNIYRGKVERVLPGMQSAFIDIGYEKNAFLYAKDAAYAKYDDNGEIFGASKGFPDISELLSEGQEITVQVVKDAAGEKGPRVSTQISLPGRYTVLLPGSNFLGVSKKIKNKDERIRLKSIASGLKPDNVGIIFRTASENIPCAQIEDDIKGLLVLWNSISKKEHKGRVPRLLYGQPGIIGHAVREYLTSDINRFIINGRKEYEDILSLLDDFPSLKMKVEYFSKNYDMFEYYHVESALDEALSRKVWLKSGGYLVFDRTEALTVIDVNSGRFVGKNNPEETMLKINMEAARAIARQIRLRDLSGIIIADFIDMQQKEHRDQIVQILRESVKTDKTQTVVLGMSSLGLVEITRKKIRQPLYKSLTVDCRACHGTGYRISPATVARRIEKRIVSLMADSSQDYIEAYVHPEIFNILENSEKENIEKIKAHYHCDLKLIPSRDVAFEEVSLRRITL